MLPDCVGAASAPPQRTKVSKRTVVQIPDARNGQTLSCIVLLLWVSKAISPKPRFRFAFLCFCGFLKPFPKTKTWRLKTNLSGRGTKTYAKSSLRRCAWWPSSNSHRVLAKGLRLRVDLGGTQETTSTADEKLRFTASTLVAGLLTKRADAGRFLDHANTWPRRKNCNRICSEACSLQTVMPATPPHSWRHTGSSACQFENASMFYSPGLSAIKLTYLTYFPADVFPTFH
jgi:hypothetical protein